MARYKKKCRNIWLAREYRKKEGYVQLILRERT